ncbi:aminotransferase class V-fold PLP-dependent enzyme [Vagococcus acidifermentans]|uniref:cysteine desulfurase n=1 Tax=Vagococcus acidifermentans TaxID=564710 RepID=A0A430B353_9ENTE|nr:aminotransferase class V-fold PLP-dependent enzyme [Vagococcus acidifermentans]RSU14776.1 cysteine desulfurase [Vagococcus acidifermentans]
MIYLDNSATTLKKPPQVAEAVMAAFNRLGNSGRGVHEDALASSQLIYEARERLCELFNGELSKQIVFTLNATESLNLAIKGLFEPGDHVITTMLEHNSVLRPLYQLEEAGVALTILPADEAGNIDYAQLEASIQPQTRGIVITHGSNLTGNVIDIERVGEIAARHDVYFVVDASQTAGALPIDVQKQQIDVLCFTGHKALFGPQGTGGLYVKPGVAIRPLKVGGSGIDTYNKRHPSVMPTALEAGTLNGHGIAGLSAGAAYILSETVPRIHQKEQELMSLFYRKVSQLDSVTVYGDFSTDVRCPIVTLNVGDMDSSEVSDILATEYHIATRSGGHCAPLMHQALGTVEQGAVRFSFSYFNTESDILSAVAALTQIVQQMEVAK